MAVESWRGLVNALLYQMQFRTALDEKAADEFARALVTEPLLDLSAAEEYALLEEAVRSDGRLTDFIPEPHGEEEVRDFLRRLVARMEALRPWPELPYQGLPVSRWDAFADAGPIARIGMRYVKVEERLRKPFSAVTAGDRRLSVLVLRLRTGEEIALAGPWWPGSSDVALLALDRDRAEETVAAFLDATVFGPENVTLEGTAGE